MVAQSSLEWDDNFWDRPFGRPLLPLPTEGEGWGEGEFFCHRGPVRDGTGAVPSILSPTRERACPGLDPGVGVRGPFTI